MTVVGSGTGVAAGAKEASTWERIFPATSEGLLSKFNDEGLLSSVGSLLKRVLSYTVAKTPFLEVANYV